MGIEIGAQLDALWRSLFLGAAFALLYDGLRALRLRRRTRRALTDLLDAVGGSGGKGIVRHSGTS